MDRLKLGTSEKNKTERGYKYKELKCKLQCRFIREKYVNTMNGKYHAPLYMS